MAGNVSSKSASLVYYDYEGKVLSQKELSLQTISPESKLLLSGAESGVFAQIINGGAAFISEDLKTVQYAYDNITTAMLAQDDSGFIISYAVNGRKERLAKLSKDLKTVIWEYTVPEDFTNKGMEFLRADRDFDGDGINDIFAIINSYDKDGQAEASWFTIISGADGSLLKSQTVKTGEATIDRKKVIYYLKAESMDIIKDIDGDKKYELLCGNTVVGSRRNTVIGELYGYIDADGVQLDIGDANGDGLKDYIVVSEKEARLYLSKLVYSYGYASVDYKKTNVTLPMDKDLDPMNTSGVLGDLDADGASEVVFIGKNDEGHQVFNVYSGSTLELLCVLCRNGCQDGEAYSALSYDINGDGINEIYGRENWEPCIFDGKTGDLLLNINRVGEEGSYYEDDMIYVGTYASDSRWYPDYNVPFMAMDEAPQFIMTEDADGDGLKDLACLANVWDMETFTSNKMLISLSGKTFEKISETDLGGRLDVYTVLPVENSSRYLALTGDASTAIIDMEEKKLLAQFASSSSFAMMLENGELLTGDKNGELYTLNLNKSFDLSSSIPEETDNYILDLSWKALQDNSIMTIYDNNSAVYSGNGESASIKLLQGEHSITLAMNDGQGKTYSEMYDVTVTPQHTSYVWLAVIAGAALLACIFFGAARRARIAGLFRRAAK